MLKKKENSFSKNAEEKIKGLNSVPEVYTNFEHKNGGNGDRMARARRQKTRRKNERKSVRKGEAYSIVNERGLPTLRVFLALLDGSG